MRLKGDTKYDFLEEIEDIERQQNSQDETSTIHASVGEHFQM